MGQLTGQGYVTPQHFLHLHKLEELTNQTIYHQGAGSTNYVGLSSSSTALAPTAVSGSATASR